MLDQITPLILTYNEAANIGRTLERLTWAREVVVVDSFSDDDTLNILSSFPRVRLVQRKFDTHERQWNFGLKETDISTEWVMTMDADFVLTTELIEEIAHLQPRPNIRGYRAPFVFCIDGRRLRCAICPPATFLFRRDRAQYFQDGHTQKLRLFGKIESLLTPILHDDRKPWSRWVESQERYALLEAQKRLDSSVASLDAADRVRKLRVVAPCAMGLYCLIVRGGILDGWAGFYYAFQRMTAELMLSRHLIRNDFGLKRRTRVRGRS